MNRILLLIFSVALLLAGCSVLPSKIETPSLHVADVRLVSASLFEQRFIMSLRVQNPNDFELPIDAITYDLLVNDKPFAKGASSQAATIPRLGSGLVEVEGVSTLGNLLRQLSETQNGSLQGLRYQLKGQLTLQGFGGKMPFDYTGEIGLNNLLPGGDKAKSREF